MARSLSTQELNAWNSGYQSTWVRAVVNDGSTDRELNDLESRDWIRSLQYALGVDKHLTTATVVCHLRDGEYNLAPLDGGSPINSSPHSTLLAIGNSIKIYTATMPSGTTPVAADWQLVFDGYIEETTIRNGDTISVRCHDIGTDLMSAFVETATTYPKSGGSGTAVHQVIQDILNDHGGSVVVNVDGTTPTAIVKEYLQRREPVWSAVKAIADQIGYDLKYQWDGASVFQLYIIEPDRAASTPDWTLTDTVWDTLSVQTARADVRNAISVVYFDSGQGDTRQQVSVTDAASVSKYGRRYMELAEEKGSQIDTSTEATALATAILGDLKEPTAYVAVNIPYLYGVELRDLIRFTADNIHFNTNQDLAVTSIAHNIPQKGRGITSLQVSGLPAAGVSHWKEIQAQYSQRRLATRNFGYSVGLRSNVCPNPNFDELDS